MENDICAVRQQKGDLDVPSSKRSGSSVIGAPHRVELARSRLLQRLPEWQARTVGGRLTHVQLDHQIIDSSDRDGSKDVLDRLNLGAVYADHRPSFDAHDVIGIDGDLQLSAKVGTDEADTRVRPEGRNVMWHWLPLWRPTPE